MIESIDMLSQWASQHAWLAGFCVFLIALSESLAVVGMMVPGVMMMFVIGALIGNGSLSFGVMFCCAVAGAITGDVLSFWLGYHYQGYLKQIWPFRTHPHLLERGICFFQRYGGKSILFGRFVGPVRAVIPLVAGMMLMPVPRFLFANVISALLWAPAYLLPGIVLGASFELASQIATRLALFMLISIVLTWFLVWFFYKLFQILQPRTELMINKLVLWSQQHKLLGELGLSIIDPHHKELKGLLTLALMFVVICFLLYHPLHELLLLTSIAKLDQNISIFMTQLQTGWGNYMMISLTQLGDNGVIIPLVMIMSGWLLWQRDHFKMIHLLGALFFCAGATFFLKNTLQIPRPDLIAMPLNSYAFPSGHTLNASVIFGFFAIMIASVIPVRFRIIPYTVSVVLIIGIAFSRLYLGLHWLSDVVGSLVLGGFWVIVLGTACRRHAANKIPAVPFIAFFLLSFSVIVATYHFFVFEIDRQHYALKSSVMMVNKSQWLSGESGLPLFRHDLRDQNRDRMVMQWSGDLDNIHHTLRSNHWQTPPHQWQSYFRFLLSTPEISEVPVLPQLHKGKAESLVMIKPNTKDTRLVIRLWDPGFFLENQHKIWIGTVMFQRLQNDNPLTAYTTIVPEYSQPVSLFQDEMKKTDWHLNVTKNQILLIF